MNVRILLPLPIMRRSGHNLVIVSKSTDTRALCGDDELTVLPSRGSKYLETGFHCALVP